MMDNIWLVNEQGEELPIGFTRQEILDWYGPEYLHLGLPPHEVVREFEIIEWAWVRKDEDYQTWEDYKKKLRNQKHES